MNIEPIAFSFCTALATAFAIGLALIEIRKIKSGKQK